MYSEIHEITKTESQSAIANSELEVLISGAHQLPFSYANYMFILYHLCA